LQLKRFLPVIALFFILDASSLMGAATASAASRNTTAPSGLSQGQQQALYAIAKQTWRFFDADTDPNTHLPMDTSVYTERRPKGLTPHLLTLAFIFGA
jgi:hypothetical protein